MIIDAHSHMVAPNPLRHKATRVMAGFTTFPTTFGNQLDIGIQMKETNSR